MATTTVKLGSKKRLNKEQLGNSEPFSMTNMPLNTQYVTNSTLVSPVKMEYALQMFAGIYGGFIGKSPYSDFHCNICREFDFTGILLGYPTLDVGKSCINYVETM